jgi:hypothetical protein
MSDEVELKREATQKVLFKNSIFFCVGWFVLMISLLGLNYLGVMGSFIYKFSGVLIAIGWGLIGLPKIWIIIRGGGLGGALKADYEVVTYENGVRVSSDGGSQSLGTNFIMKLVQIGLIYVIGAIIQTIHLIILSIKYMVLHGKAKPKPAFIKSGLFIIVINLAVFIGSPILGIVIQVVGGAVREAAAHAERVAQGEKIVGDFRIIPNETKSGILIEEYVGKGGSVVIPATFDGLPVVGVYGFDGKPITSVVIPDTVIYIEGNAFSDCTELKQVTLPKNLKFIRTSAFYKSGLTSVTIPEGVTDIGASAFGCTNLTSVTLPRSLQRVGGYAFYDCTSLVNVTIPSGHTIKYGVYQSTSAGVNEIPIEGMGSAKSFVERQHDYEGSFKGCTSLSAESRQAIEDSGYIGEF